MKGCYLFCTDPETAAHFRERIASGAERPPLRRVAEDPGKYDLDDGKRINEQDIE